MQSQKIQEGNMNLVTQLTLEDYKTVNKLVAEAIQLRDDNGGGFLQKIKYAYSTASKNINGIKTIEDLATLGLLMLADGINENSDRDGINELYFTSQEAIPNTLTINAETLKRIEKFEDFKKACEDKNIYDTKQQSLAFIAAMQWGKEKVQWVKEKEIEQKIEQDINQFFNEHNFQDEITAAGKKFGDRLSINEGNRCIQIAHDLTVKDKTLFETISTIFYLVMGALSFMLNRATIEKEGHALEAAVLELFVQNKNSAERLKEDYNLQVLRETDVYKKIMNLDNQGYVYKKENFDNQTKRLEEYRTLMPNLNTEAVEKEFLAETKKEIMRLKDSLFEEQNGQLTLRAEWTEKIHSRKFKENGEEMINKLQQLAKSDFNMLSAEQAKAICNAFRTIQKIDAQDFSLRKLLYNADVNKPMYNDQKIQSDVALALAVTKATEEPQELPMEENHVEESSQALHWEELQQLNPMEENHVEESSQALHLEGIQRSEHVEESSQALPLDPLKGIQRSEHVEKSSKALYWEDIQRSEHVEKLSKALPLNPLDPLEGIQRSKSFIEREEREKRERSSSQDSEYGFGKD